MSENPFARPPACARCHDTRKLTRSARAHLETDVLPCPSCGQMSAEEYERFTRAAWARSHQPPAICELDLNATEFTTFKRLRAEHPGASKLTVLSWLEGQRYNPADDPEFLAECAALMPTAEQEVEQHLGPPPNWVKARIAGEYVETTPNQERFLAAWIAKYPTKPEHEVSAPARKRQKPAPRAPAPRGAVPSGEGATQVAAPGVVVRNGRESSANAEKAPDSTESNLGVEESAECRKIATPGEDSDAPPF